MFGKNPVMKQDLGDGRSLKVVGIWPTIQGEGPFAGEPAVFVRLHGCNLRCFFCDTEFSNPDDAVMPLEVILDLIKTAPMKACFAPINLVVITGGEPFRQNITPLLSALTSKNYRVQIETAGTLWIDGLEDMWETLKRTTIVVSPKTPRLHPMIERHADAYKYVIHANWIDDRDGLPNESTQKPKHLAPPARPPSDFPKHKIFLSPMDTQTDDRQNAKNRAAVAERALKHGYRAGLQLHKFMGVE